MQSTQLITILGDGAGYLLPVNLYMAEVVEPEERTVAFGVLAGIAMLGVANCAFQRNESCAYRSVHLISLTTKDTSAAA
jgi:hypothetical protein